MLLLEFPGKPFIIVVRIFRAIRVIPLNEEEQVMISETLNLNPVWREEPPFDTIADFLSHNEQLLWRVSIRLKSNGRPLSLSHALYRKTEAVVQGIKVAVWEPAGELSMGEVRSHCDLMQRVAEWCEHHPGHPLHDEGSRDQCYFQAHGTVAALGSLDSN